MARWLAFTLLALVACKTTDTPSQPIATTLPEIVFVGHAINGYTKEEQAVFELVNNTDQIYTYRHQMIPIYTVMDFCRQGWMEGFICGNGIRDVKLLPGVHVPLKFHLKPYKGPIQLQMHLRNASLTPIEIHSEVYEIVNHRVQVPGSESAH